MSQIFLARKFKLSLLAEQVQVSYVEVRRIWRYRSLLSKMQGRWSKCFPVRFMLSLLLTFPKILKNKILWSLCFAFAFSDANINSLNAATAIPGCCAVSWQHLLNMTRTTYILADLAYFFVFAASGARFAGETSLSREVPLPELT